jgi:hypothetical protein
MGVISISDFFMVLNFLFQILDFGFLAFVLRCYFRGLGSLGLSFLDLAFLPCLLFLRFS